MILPKVFPTLLSACFLAALVGCNKESAAPNNASPATASGTAAAAENDVVGKWRASSVEGALPDGLKKDVLSSSYEIRPNHTYSNSNSMAGRSHGTWALAGATLTLTPDASNTFMKASTLNVELPHLANRDPALSVIYDKTGPASADDKPQVTATASDFLTEVSKDEAAAKKKYDGMRVELTGVVTGIEQRASGTYVTVAGPPDAGKDASDLFGGVQCQPIDAEIWALLAPTQPVKVLGVASVAYGSGSMSEAKFTLDGPSVLIITSAEDLAAEYAKDPQATKAKYSAGYHGKAMIVTGPLLEKHIEDGKESVLVLGKGDAKVTCSYSNSGSDVAKALAPLEAGQTVKLAGEYTPEGKVAALQNCMLITK